MRDMDGETTELGQSLLRRATEPGVVRRMRARASLGGSTLAADILQRWTPGMASGPGGGLVYASVGAPVAPVAPHPLAPSPISLPPTGRGGTASSLPEVKVAAVAEKVVLRPAVVEIGPAIVARRPGLTPGATQFRPPGSGNPDSLEPGGRHSVAQGVNPGHGRDAAPPIEPNMPIVLVRAQSTGGSGGGALHGRGHVAPGFNPGRTGDPMPLGTPRDRAIAPEGARNHDRGLPDPGLKPGATFPRPQGALLLPPMLPLEIPGFMPAPFSEALPLPILKTTTPPPVPGNEVAPESRDASPLSRSEGGRWERGTGGEVLSMKPEPPDGIQGGEVADDLAERVMRQLARSIAVERGRLGGR